MRLLIIEDEVLVCDTIRLGWPVAEDELVFAHSRQASSVIIDSPDLDAFDGIILDVNLPDGSGMDVLHDIRAATDVPIVLISGGGSADSRADALDLGADDYVMKPFSVRELQARIARQHRRRNARGRARASDSFVIGTIRCDLRRRILSTGDTELPLTDAEARLLSYLLRYRDRTCSKAALYKHAFFRGHDPQDNTLEVYLSRVRKKLALLDAKAAESLQTVRGSGYRLIGEGS